MIVEFDYSRLGRVGSAQPSLIVSVNGQEVFSNHGIDVINGEFGSLGVCRDGRYVYEVFPPFYEGFSDQEEFYLNIDDGSRFCLVFKRARDELQTFQFSANRETGEWEKLPCPDLVE